MWLTITLLSIFPLGFFLFYRSRKEKHRLFKNLGVPGPEPHWFYGSFDFSKIKDMYEYYQDWTKKYGKTYGYFEGPTAVLVTSDVDFIKQVFIKNFDCFHARKPEPLSVRDEDNFVEMFSACGSRWKRLRTIVNPTFNSSKMKKMFPMIQDCTKLLIKRLENCAEGEKVLDIYGHFGTHTLDVIAKCAFGIDTECQIKEGHPFLKTLKAIFDEMENPPAAFKLPILLPMLSAPMFKLLAMITYFYEDPYFKLGQYAKEVINQRKASGEEGHDLLQLMINSTSDDGDTSTKDILSKGSDPGTTPRNKKLTEDEVMWQSVVFLIAGYETTSTALAYCSYELALNPDIQSKLQAEIDEHLPENEEPTYEKINEMEYLDKVFCETLRIHPIAIQVVNRECMQPVTIKGIHIPVGMVVQVDGWSLHFDKDNWGPSDPKAFDPERFSPEMKSKRDPLTYMPFGVGPRNCVGMRFAVMEGKLALCRLLQKFTILSCDETEVPLVVRERGTVAPVNGVKVKLIKRF